MEIYQFSNENLDKFIKEIVNNYQLTDIDDDKMINIFKKYATSENSSLKKKRGRPPKKHTDDYKINHFVDMNYYNNIEWDTCLKKKKYCWKLYINNYKILICNDNIYEELVYPKDCDIYKNCEKIIIEKLMDGYYF